MAISENYIPQAENLEYLKGVIEELHSISQRNTDIKNKIVTSVDSLIHDLNGEEDHSAVTSQLNNFLETYGASVKTSHLMTQQEELEAQNEKLKQILESKRIYNIELMKLNKEYENSIDTLMDKIRDMKEGYDHARLTAMKEAHRRIEDAQKKEYDAYHLLIKNEEIMSHLAKTLTEFYGFFDDNRENDEGMEQIKFMLLLLKGKLDARKDARKDAR
jgi:hypothetical protein